MSNEKEHMQRSAQAAASWVARLSDADLNDAERRELQEWLAADPEHRRQFRAMQAIWTAAPAGAVASDRRTTERVRSSIRWLPLGIAASLLLAVATALFVSFPRYTTYATAIGEQRVVTVEDGSTVNINTGSEVALRITDELRRAELRSGEAFFSVRRDPQRRFEVYLGDAVIEVVGTRFEVRRESAYFSVNVVEGTVRVTTPAGPGTTTLNAGERLLYRHGEASATVERVGQAATPDWVAGKLRFEQTPLATALAEANRYRRLPLVIEDGQLASVKVTGTFWIGRLDEIVTILEGQGLVRAEQAADGRSVRLYTP